MTVAPKIDQARRARLATLMVNGASIKTASAECSVSESFARKIRRQARELGTGDTHAGLLMIADGKDQATYHRPKKLRKEAVEALDNIEYFADRYFGLTLKPWQVEAAAITRELLDTPDKEYICENVPPGGGKSTFHLLLMPAWLTCLDRTIRGLLGSAAQGNAETYLVRLRRALDTSERIRATPRELALGVAHDAQAVLSADYGTFRPDSRAGLPWRDDAFTVIPPPGYPPSQKEPTWQAYGRTRSFIGMRVDFQAWDDAYDPVQVKTPEAHDELYRWWDENVETRLEPGGLLIVQGQRLGPQDIYRHCLDKATDVLDDEDEDDDVPEPAREVVHVAVGGDGEVAGPPGPPTAESGDQPHVGLPPKEGKYRHIIYKAHYDELCTGKHPKSLKPYPASCLLDPIRIPWRQLAAVKAENPGRYATIYQQDDTPVGSVLVHPLWITGGRNPDTGETYPGCWDDERPIGEVPLVAGRTFSCATVDPSPEKYWAVEWWLFSVDTELRYLIDIERTKMRAADLIDWNNATQTWTGLMPEWQQRSRILGKPITHWVIEQNAAQRFLLQYEHVTRWRQKNSVVIVGHETMTNRSDPKLGVDTIAPHYKHGRVRLPGAGNRRQPGYLVDEVTKYPMGRTNDTVMAHWFFEFNLPRLFQRVEHKPSKARRPSWIGSVPDLRRTS